MGVNQIKERTGNERLSQGDVRRGGVSILTIASKKGYSFPKGSFITKQRKISGYTNSRTGEMCSKSTNCHQN